VVVPRKAPKDAPREEPSGEPREDAPDTGGAQWPDDGSGPGGGAGLGLGFGSGFGTGEGRLRAADELAGLPGMTGGIFIPFDDEELAGTPEEERRPLPGALAGKGSGGAEEGEAAAEGAPAAEVPKRRKGLRGLLRPGGGAGGGARARVRGWGSPVLLLAALLLVAGVVIGSWIPLGLGWLTAYLSRAHTRTQAKIAVFGVPGATALGFGVWIWGRTKGRWGSPIADGRLGHVIRHDLPIAVRVAAVASALYLVLRARRSAG
jgi:hypothetical protein